MARNEGEEFGDSVRGICVQRREGVAGTRASLLTGMTAENPGLHWIRNVSCDAHHGTMNAYRILWGRRLRRSADFVSKSLHSLCRLEQAGVRSCDLG